MITKESLYTEELRNAISVATAIAKEYHQAKIYPPHILIGLLHPESGIKNLLTDNDVDIYYLEEWAEVKSESLPKTGNIPDSFEMDESTEAIFQEALNIDNGEQNGLLTPLSVLIALSTPGVGFSFDQLKTFSVSRNELMALQGNTSSSDSIAKKETKHAATSSFLIDLTSKIQENNYKVTQRDQELLGITEIIARHNKPHIIISGEPGVGKSSLIEGLAEMAHAQRGSQQLNNTPILQLNTDAMITGISYKGELEDRLQKTFSSLKNMDRPILFIDDLQIIMDEQIGGKGVLYLLKSELNKGNFVLIGTVSNEAYRKLLEKDDFLNRLFERIELDEPSKNAAAEMVSAHTDQLQEHHNALIDSNTINSAVDLAKRHFNERKLPDSAIDLIDRTMAAIRTQLDTIPSELERIKSQLNQEESTAIIEFELHKYLRYAGIEDDENTEGNNKSIEELILQLEEHITNRTNSIEVNDLAATVSRVKGIPAGKIMAQERERLLNMEDALSDKVIGQNLAVNTICESILESRSGLNRPGQPIGSFFFLGPTGTGKTELAKQIADYLFQSADSLIRFDMSEFKEEHSAALLYGAPPGYVGYEEGGMLVNKIRQKPYSVVLFDEIEKAHPSVFDIFLQILDEGKLNDRLGKVGDFSNAVILFTSNIGSNTIVDLFNKEGILPEQTSLMEQMALHFRPEFLGRLTGLVPFAPITKESITKIFDIQVNELLALMQRQELNLSINDDAKVFLAEEGYTPQYGARPLRAVIRTRLKTPISKMIIRGELSKGDCVTVSYKDNKISLDVKKSEEPVCETIES